MYEILFLDIDQDGDIDLLTYGLLFNGASIYWFENDGAGTILSARPYEGPSNLDWSINGDIRRVDLDSDGDLDFTSTIPPFGVATFEQNIWRENFGNDDLGPPMMIISDPRWVAPRSFAMMDVDQDGMKDLISLSVGDPRLEWFKITRTPEPAAYTTAMEALDLTGHSAGPFSDWDLDGLTNWIEFAFGSNAAAPDRNHPGLPALRMTEGGWTYSFQRRLDAEALGLSYEHFSSPDLSDWLPWAPSGTTSPGEPGYERVVLPVTFDEPREFFTTEIPDPAEP